MPAWPGTAKTHTGLHGDFSGLIKKTPSGLAGPAGLEDRATVSVSGE
jgi:hypothetical protein